MNNSIDEAIRIARRAAQHGTARPGDRAVNAVFSALAAEPDPDAEGTTINEGWRWESDGTGKPAKRHDQYIVADGELERIATFEGPDAAKNARAASCTPLMIAALKFAEEALKIVAGAVKMGDLDLEDLLYAPALAEVRRALKETRFRKSR
jgi:hypothetical protein